jgi:hypothetical protein
MPLIRGTLMTGALNKRQIGEQNAERFRTYLKEGLANNSLPWKQDGTLERNRMAKDLGLARSAFLQNPGIRTALRDIEQKSGPGIQAMHKIAGERASGVRLSGDQMLDEKLAKAEARALQLEEENRFLREKLKDLGFSLNMPSETAGRLPW